MQAAACACALLVVLPLGLVSYQVVKNGVGALDWAFFTQLPRPAGEAGGGMANAMVGTFELLGLALVLGAPVGVCGGIYLAEYGSTRLHWWVRFAADVLNGAPPIVWGMVVCALVVEPMRSASAWAGGIVLGFIMIPMIMRATEEALRLVPQACREAALALGIPLWRAILQIVARAALRGIVTAVLLALARVAGETAPLLFTAVGSRFWNHGLSEPVAALPLQIFNCAVSRYEDWHRQAWAGALALLVVVGFIHLAARFIGDKRSGNDA